ncbi:hypothetical protein BACT_0602 [Bifidobacterium actinocoloniiforme DSM 22766]|uniref:Uncharacterized protein n=1 Tax=Bifidobacterium actinocoloniiforme DSM 22766 TaxID=1437605 RepID=A0A086Z051_9BIFI|nr:hypothetical protein [Bifidobacterium actinocoloniiforme]AKV55163.1 hypothetical protein AB656_01620 [Bifidobacterium actinocoloniiforme DSM 22766]KFI39901.1 hypothetical protein BACT_0602 [Bifidobacterium actinocoloniiforme DSM 22766]
MNENENPQEPQEPQAQNGPATAPGQGAQPGPQAQSEASAQSSSMAQGQAPASPEQAASATSGAPGGADVQGQQGQPAPDYKMAAEQPGQGATKTKRTWLIVAVVVVVIAALAAAVLVMKPWAPKPADYRQAANAAADIRSQKNKIADQLGEAYIAAGDPNKEFSQQDVDKLKNSIDKLDQMNKDFAKQKAVKDKDVNAKYQTYLEKSKRYDAFVGDLAASAPAYAKAGKACGQEPELASTSDTTEYLNKVNDFISSCKASLDAVVKAPNKTLSDYAKETSGSLSQLQDVLKQTGDLVNNLNSDNLSQSMSKLTDLEQQARDIEKDTPKSLEVRSNLRDEEKKVSPDASLNDLYQILQNKAGK